MNIQINMESKLTDVVKACLDTFSELEKTGDVTESYSVFEEKLENLRREMLSNYEKLIQQNGLMTSFIASHSESAEVTDLNTKLAELHEKVGGNLVLIKSYRELLGILYDL
jgi:hypothetical protein